MVINHLLNGMILQVSHPLQAKKPEAVSPAASFILKASKVSRKARRSWGKAMGFWGEGHGNLELVVGLPTQLEKDAHKSNWESCPQVSG